LGLRSSLRTLVKCRPVVPIGPRRPAKGQQSRQSAPLEQVRLLIGKLAPHAGAGLHLRRVRASGKELAARLIHENLAPGHKLFVPVNCGALPENLMESEFFGYKKGAFTGAAEESRRLFSRPRPAARCSLDEVADLPLPMQVKLLRAIQEKRVRKIGATQEDPVDVRIICARTRTSPRCRGRPLPAGSLLPAQRDRAHHAPLRECREDIPVIAASILGGSAAGGQRTCAAHRRSGRGARALRFPRQHPRAGKHPGARRRVIRRPHRCRPICARAALTDEEGVASGNATLPDYLDGLSARRSWMRSPRPISTVPPRRSFRRQGKNYKRRLCGGAAQRDKATSSAPIEPRAGRSCGRGDVAVSAMSRKGSARRRLLTIAASRVLKILERRLVGALELDADEKKSLQRARLARTRRRRPGALLDGRTAAARRRGAPGNGPRPFQPKKRFRGSTGCRFRVQAIGEQPLDLVSAVLAGGRLIECSTSSVISAPAGRSSQLGEAM